MVKVLGRRPISIVHLTTAANTPLYKRWRQLQQAFGSESTVAGSSGISQALAMQGRPTKLTNATVACNGSEHCALPCDVQVSKALRKPGVNWVKNGR